MLSKKIGLPDYFLTDSRYSYIGKSTDGNIGIGATLHLITTVNDLVECLSKGGQCDALTLDFSKAFSKLPDAHLSISETLPL